jgi:hypothetical protein
MIGVPAQRFAYEFPVELTLLPSVESLVLMEGYLTSDMNKEAKADSLSWEKVFEKDYRLE